MKHSGVKHTFTINQNVLKLKEKISKGNEVYTNL